MLIYKKEFWKFKMDLKFLKAKDEQMKEVVNELKNIYNLQNFRQVRIEYSQIEINKSNKRNIIIS